MSNYAASGDCRDLASGRNSADGGHRAVLRNLTIEGIARVGLACVVIASDYHVFETSSYAFTWHQEAGIFYQLTKRSNAPSEGI